ncbi:MAG: class I SAM-dependent methyltransferase [Candidatus Omnitrophota bacterium]
MRPFFKGKEYVGCDVREGHNVDRVENLERLNLKDSSIGTAVVLETMEHVEDIQKAFKELYRVLKPGGVLIVASPFIFPIHDLPNDYWRFTPKALSFLMKDFSVKLLGTHADPIMPHTVYGIGFKATAKDEVTKNSDKFIKDFTNASMRKKKFSYELSLFLKGLMRGKEYVENVRKRHIVKFDFF